MPDYAKTCIYQIQCRDPSITKTYGGHSINLIKRRGLHKSVCNNPNAKNYNCYVYRFIRENGGWDNWQVVWQYDYPCGSKKEALLEETKFIKEQKCELNSNMPYIPGEDKKEKNRISKSNSRAKKIVEETEEVIKEKNREYDTKYWAKRKANETPEEKKERLRKKLEIYAKRIANETPEEKKERLRIKREKDAEKKANETEEEKKERKRKNSERDAKHRAKKKAEETEEEKK